MNHQKRFLFYAPPGRIDPETHTITGVSMMQAVEATGHNVLIDSITIDQTAALAQAMPNGVKSRYTHPGLSSDGLGKFLGRIKYTHHTETAVFGDLHLSPAAAKSPDGDLRTYVETLASDDPQAFGLSVEVTGERFWILDNGNEVPATDGRPDNATTKLPVLRVTALHACDLVDEPAANRNGLFSSAFNRTTSQIAAEIYSQLDEAIALFNINYTDLPQLVEDTFHDLATNPPNPPAFTQFISNLLLDYDVEHSKAYDFAHRYIQARNHQKTAVFGRISLSSGKPAKGDIMQEQTASPTAELLLWSQAAQKQYVDLALKNSGLPIPTRQRLAKAQYATPGDLDNAIADAKAELAAIVEDETVQLGNAPTSRRPITSGMMETGMDTVENAINWFFGAPGSNLPAPSNRRLDLLYTALTGDLEFTGVFDPARTQLASANITTLPGMAVNAMNKVIALQFSVLSHWRWYEKVVALTPNDGSLHPIQWITMGGLSNLPTVADGAAYTELTVDDARENDEFLTKGGYVGITRRMIKNSDIQKVQAIPKALAVAALRTRSDTVAALFTQNSGVGPTLDDDSTALFHANHSNVATTALGTDTTAWRAARIECFKHTEVNSGKRLGVYPKFLLVPVDLFDVALSILGWGTGYPTAFTPETQDRGPDDPRAIPLAVPGWTDATDWAYLADPNIHPVIQMTYSSDPGGQSHPMPELFAAISESGGLMFSNDTLPIKVRDEWAMGVNGPRGIGKRNVA